MPCCEQESKGSNSVLESSDPKRHAELILNLELFNGWLVSKPARL